jgi:hypothetical protein
MPLVSLMSRNRRPGSCSRFMSTLVLIWLLDPHDQVSQFGLLHRSALPVRSSFSTDFLLRPDTPGRSLLSCSNLCRSRFILAAGSLGISSVCARATRSPL